jgi:hypothetical protein
MSEGLQNYSNLNKAQLKTAIQHNRNQHPFNFHDELFTDQTHNSDQPWRVKLTKTKYNEKFDTTKNKCKIEITNKLRFALVDIFKIFEDIRDSTISKFKLTSKDRIRIVVEGPGHDRPLSKKSLPIQEMTFESIWDAILHNVQYKEINLTETTITVEFVRIPAGKGRKKIIQTTTDALKKKGL